MAPPRSRPAFFVVFVLPLGRLSTETRGLLVAAFLSYIRFVVPTSHTAILLGALLDRKDA